MRRHRLNTCDVARLARSAPALKMAEAAKRAGITEAQASGRLSALKPRGPLRCGRGCSAAAAVAALDSTVAEVVAAAAAHPACPPAAVRAASAATRMAMHAFARGTAGWRARGARPDAPRNAAAVLASNTSRVAQYVAAGSGACPPAVAARLVDQSSHVRYQLIDSKTQVSAAASLASPGTAPEHLLAGLAASASAEMREHAAYNPFCGPEIFRRLAADPSTSVRLAAAMNPQCPADVLEALIADTENDSYVRLEAAANPNLSGWTI